MQGRLVRHLILFLGSLVYLAACQAPLQDDPPFFARISGEKAAEVALVGPPAEPVTAVTLAPVAAGLTKPSYLTHAGDGRFFAAEQEGVVRVIENGEVLPEPFLDVRHRLATDGSERGLLGLAFHPQYDENGYFYLVYTNLDGNTEISRYTASETDPNRADPESGTLILFIKQPYGNHNGGQLLFGPDGYFYIGLGDGGAVGDPFDNAQDAGTLLGTLLRLDVDAAEPYAIPEDNPWVNQRGARGEVWAIGLRNPWTFRFDPETGDLYLGDVGQEGPEEINFHPAGSPAGVNYGWPVLEGSDCYEAETCNSGGFRPPIFEYAHGEDGCAVIGGEVYRGQQFPQLAGNYFFSDYCTGIIWALRYDAGLGQWVRTAVAETGSQVSAITAGADGELYVLMYRTGEVLQVQAP